jgi:hypothetical protein
MVRSYERFTSQGMAVPWLSLERIVDDLLTVKYGGTSLDYQWVEVEDERGRTDLKLRISPELGFLDEKDVIHDVLNELQKVVEGGRVMSEIWRQSGMVSVIREFPKPTTLGKMVPLLREWS